MMKDGKYICTCMECEYVWETNDEYEITSHCPICYQGDIKYEVNTEYTPQTNLKVSNSNKKDEIV